MTAIAYTLTLNQRVSAGQRSEVVNLRTAHGVLPGSVIRGALAAAWLSQNKMTTGDQRFSDLFERFVTFGQAVPDAATQTRLEPPSCYRCKYGANCPRTWTDLALRRTDGDQDPTTCPSCGGGIEFGKGWQLGWGLRASATSLEMTGNETAKEGNLYSRESLRHRVDSGESLRLSGRLHLAAEAPQEIAAEFEALADERRLWLGGRKSVMGETSWQGELAPPVEPDGETPVAIRLRSSAIVLDEYGVCSTDQESVQAELCRVLDRQVSVRREWSRPVRIEGWHMASGYPKPHEWAVDAGATYLVDGLSPGDDVLLLGGIGVRRVEGFGEVILATQSQLEADLAALNETVSPATVADVHASASASAARPEPEPERDEFALLRGVLNNVRVAVMTVSGYRQYRMPQSHIDDFIAVELAKPWVLGLHSAAKEQVTNLLHDDDIAGAAARIQRAIDGR